MPILEMKVPSPGESISEVEIAAWLVSDGDYVEKDQAIAEVDSDKATLELPAEAAGVITLKSEEGDVVPVGGVCCLIDTDAERPAGAPCTLENLENIKNLKRDQLPIDCKGKELKTDKKVVLPDMSGDKVDFSSCAPPRPAPAPRHALSGAPNARASPTAPPRCRLPRPPRRARRGRARRSTPCTG